MALRTGAQLETDVGAVSTALTTAVGTPTLANAQAVVTAARTVEANGRDSRNSIPRTDTGSKEGGEELNQLIGSLRGDVETAITKTGNGAATADLGRLLRRIQNNYFGTGTLAATVAKYLAVT